MKKRFACCAEEREKECDHPAGFAWTGRQVCHLCGQTREQAHAESKAKPTEAEVTAKRTLRVVIERRLGNLAPRSKAVKDLQQDFKKRRAELDAEVAVCELALELLDANLAGFRHP